MAGAQQAKITIRGRERGRGHKDASAIEETKGFRPRVRKGHHVKLGTWKPLNPVPLLPPARVYPSMLKQYHPFPLGSSTVLAYLIQPKRLKQVPRQLGPPRLHHQRLELSKRNAHKACEHTNCPTTSSAFSLRHKHHSVMVRVILAICPAGTRDKGMHRRCG
jgi:hypothetical protein